VREITPTLGAAHAEVLRTLRNLSHIACPEEAAGAVLEIVAGARRQDALADPERELPEPHRERLMAVLRRASAGMPLAYALGECFFAGRRFSVTREVLIPRPDTETLLAAAHSWALAQARPMVVAEVGVGSGAVIISLAAGLAGCNCKFFGTDTSPAALAVAGRNAERHGVQVELLHGSVLEPLPADTPLDLILSNPPYIAEGDEVEETVRRWEPREALMVPPGAPGTYYHRLIAQQASERLRSGGALMLEVGQGQAGEVAALLTEAGYSKVETACDLGGTERVVRGEWCG